MANEGSCTGLEIRAVKNGWIVFVGNLNDAFLRGEQRPEYVFQEAHELADAVHSLLTTGKYERRPCPGPHNLGSNMKLKSVSSKEVEQNATREEDKFTVLP